MAIASKAMIPFLVSMMLVTGVCNTLLTKFQVRSMRELVRHELTSIVGHAMCTELPLTRSEEEEELRAACHSDVGLVWEKTLGLKMLTTA